MQRTKNTVRAISQLFCFFLAATLLGCAEQPAEGQGTNAVGAVAPAPTHGFLGLTFRSIEDSPLTITGTVPASGADEVGIAADDQLVAVAGTSNPTIQQIYEVISQTSPGDMLQVEVLRGELQLRLQIRLISHADVQNAMLAAQSEK